jgi:mRNA interferase RelE/StbE
MILFFERQFYKDLKVITDKKTKKQLETILTNLETVPNLTNVNHLKKLKGHTTAYRIRIGEYRLCFFYENKTAIITRILHRKEVYRYFP